MDLKSRSWLWIWIVDLIIIGNEAKEERELCRWCRLGMQWHPTIWAQTYFDQPSGSTFSLVFFLYLFAFSLNPWGRQQTIFQPEHSPHFWEFCDIGRSGLGNSWSGRVAFLDDILICFLQPILISLSSSSSPISLPKVLKISFPFYNSLYQDCRISWSSPNHSLSASPQSVPLALSYSFPDPPLPLL